MATHRATCQDCPETYADADLLKVSEWAEDHQRTEVHDVRLERAIATDGGADHVIVSRYRTRGVYHDPDPGDPDEPACHATEWATEDWQRRSLATLSERYSYCKYCDPGEHVAPEGQPETQLAARFWRDVTDIEDGELVFDGDGAHPTAADGGDGDA